MKNLSAPITTTEPSLMNLEKSTTVQLESSVGESASMVHKINQKNSKRLSSDLLRKEPQSLSTDWS